MRLSRFYLPLRSRRSANDDSFRNETDIFQNPFVRRTREFAGVRREVFSRNFTHALGMTPKEYLVRHLMSKASSLLLNPNMRVSDIVKRLGVNDEFYFSRFFRHNSGLSPTEFRKIQ